MKKLKMLLGILIAAVASSATAASLALARDGENFTIKPTGLAGQPNIYLVWDTVDRGNAIDSWANRREVSHPDLADGMTITTPVAGVPFGSRVRVIAQSDVALLDGPVEMTRDQQFIDTGIAGNAATGCEFGFLPTGRSTGWASALSAKCDNFTFGNENTNNLKMYLRWRTVDKGRCNLTGGQCNVIALNANNDGKWLCNNAQVNDGYANQTLGTDAGKIAIGTNAERNRWLYCKWWYVKLYNNKTTLARHYQAARRLSDGVNGFWEDVSKSFVVNQGTGGNFTSSANPTETRHTIDLTASNTVALRLDDCLDMIGLTIESGNLVATVPAGVFPSTTQYQLVWDEADRGTALSNWAHAQAFACTDPTVGGALTLPCGTVGTAKFVRVLAVENMQLLDGPVKMTLDRQQIDTRIAVPKVCGLEMGLKLTGRSSTWASVVGATRDNFTIGNYDGDLTKLYMRFRTVDTAKNPALDNSKCNDISIRGGVWTVNGVEQTGAQGMIANAPIGTDKSNVFLGTTANQDRWAHGEWWYAKLYDVDDVLLRSFVPAKNPRTNRVGFFESVSGEFYTNDGNAVDFTSDGAASGTVCGTLATSPLLAVGRHAVWTGAGVAGNLSDPNNWRVTDTSGEVVPNAVPDGATLVAIGEEGASTTFTLPAGQSFVCGGFDRVDVSLAADSALDGAVHIPVTLYDSLVFFSGSYVDSGFFPTGRTHVSMDVAVQADSEYWFGAWNVAYNAGAFSFCNDGTGSYSGYGNKSVGTPKNTQVPAGRHTIEMDRGVAKVDGTTWSTHHYDAAEFQVYHSLYIAGQNRSGVIQQNMSGAGIKIYSCKIWEDDVLVRDFVPARRADGRCGLYDRLANKFYACWHNGAICRGAAGETLTTCNSSFYLPEGSKIDLAGHNLSIPGATLFEGGVAVFDNTSDTRAALNVDVDGSVHNGEVEIKGNIQLVKNGVGRLVAARQNQGYTGGTRINAGAISLESEPKGSGLYFPLGADQSGIFVAAGAEFDLNGNYNYCRYPFTLDGGTIANRGAAAATQGHAGLGAITLTADSQMILDRGIVVNSYAPNNEPYEFNERIWTPAVIDLGGKTLTVTIASGFYLDINRYLTIRNGTLATRGAGTFRPDGDSIIDASAATFDIGTKYEVYGKSDLVVGDLIVRNDIAWNYGDKRILVTGTFKPVANGFNNTVLQDGATLDLSEQTGVWNTQSVTTGRFATFADGAKIKVDLGDRTGFADGAKLVSWTTEPASDVTFVMAPDSKYKYSKLSRKTDGLYFHGGLIVTIR